MENVAKIGRYQLENLLRNNVGFVFLDLRSSERRASELQDHPLLAGSVSVQIDRVISHVQGLGCPAHTPIVLICENGTKSVAAVRELEQNSFINVFVFEGGTEALVRDQS
jgi:rhodanese-related sulfurtransferase